MLPDSVQLHCRVNIYEQMSHLDIGQKLHELVDGAFPVTDKTCLINNSIILYHDRATSMACPLKFVSGRQPLRQKLPTRTDRRLPGRDFLPSLPKRTNRSIVSFHNFPHCFFQLQNNLRCLDTEGHLFNTFSSRVTLIFRVNTLHMLLS
jgi:hypothetical protein